MPRGSDGRFIPKTGAPIKPDAAPATAIVLIPTRDDADVKSGTKIVTAGVAIDFDPAYIVDAMSRAHMMHTRDAIIAGERPDGQGAQRGLGPRAATAERISEVRNVRTGELVDGIRRTPIVSDGTVASCWVYPPLSRQAHVAREQKRGVVLLTGAGAAGKAASDAAKLCVKAMMSGRTLIADKSETTAKDADK